MLLYHIITSRFICVDLQLLQPIEEPMHFPLSKAVNIFYERIVYLRGGTLLPALTLYVVSDEITSDKRWTFAWILGYSWLLFHLGRVWLLCYFPSAFP